MPRTVKKRPLISPILQWWALAGFAALGIAAAFIYADTSSSGHATPQPVSPGVTFTVPAATTPTTVDS